MAEPVKVGFERSIAVVPISALLPLKTVPEEIKQSAKFKQIARSVGEVGIIEPLVVARSKAQKGKYLLLDGHMRHAVLTDIGATEVRCLIAADDEAYTYNKRINRLATVQEHFMIVRAIERGVSEEKLAKALLAATRQADLVKSEEPKRIAGMTPEQMARMEREMEKVQRDLKTVESRYGEDVLQLVIASGYLAKLVANAEIKRYLGQHHPEILSEFRAVIAAASLDQVNTA
jgi:hypothetical protein